ncbi:MAG: DUF2304 domain-containing protein [Proteobacteria bacterium]|nr:DUF2304 domain-containing protein [Pseudomonadota bacterium]
MKLISLFLSVCIVLIVIVLRNYDRLSYKLFTRLIFSLFVSTFIFFSFFPTLIQSMASVLGVGRGADFLLYLTVLAVISLSGIVVVKNRQQEEKIVNLTRYIALQESQTRLK